MPEVRPEQAQFRRAVSETLGAACEAGEVPNARAVWRALGDAGLIAMLGDPAAKPGLLDDFMSELDCRLPTGPALAVCVQVALALPLLRTVAVNGKSDLAHSVLADAEAGKAVVAVAATDANLSGAALLDISTSLRIASGVLRLVGRKAWITNAAHCDYVLVLARHQAGRHFTSLCWVLVPADAEGVVVESATHRLFAGAAVGHLVFDDVVVGPDCLVARRGRALVDLARHLETERLAGALWGRALCRRVLTDTLNYLRHRSAGATTLWENEAVRERFARCLVALAALDALCIAHPISGSSSAAAMMLKAACGQTVNLVLDECLTLCGADAFADNGLSLLREEAAMFGIAGGATGPMLAGVAEHAAEFLAAPTLRFGA